MIRLTSAEQARGLAGRIPALAVRRMEQFEGEDGLYDPELHGCIVVLEKGDDLSRDVPVPGGGLLAQLGEEEPSPFEYVCFVRENGRRVFEATIPLAGDAMLALIVPDEPWVDERLRLVLDAEGEEES